MGRATVDLLQGSLDLLVLRVLADDELHGWGISKRIRERSHGALEVNQGSLYPALYRLRDQGLLDARWGVSREGRRAKFYRLTGTGQARFEEERKGWRMFSDAVEHVLAGI